MEGETLGFCRHCWVLPMFLVLSPHEDRYLCVPVLSPLFPINDLFVHLRLVARLIQQTQQDLTSRIIGRSVNNKLAGAWFP